MGCGFRCELSLSSSLRRMKGRVRDWKVALLFHLQKFSLPSPTPIAYFLPSLARILISSSFSGWKISKCWVRGSLYEFSFNGGIVNWGLALCNGSAACCHLLPISWVTCAGGETSLTIPFLSNRRNLACFHIKLRLREQEGYLYYKIRQRNWQTNSEKSTFLNWLNVNLLFRMKWVRNKFHWTKWKKRIISNH